MIEIGAVASEYTNLTTRDISALPKNGGSDVAEITMSFDDFIDMINPLEHIPVLSTIYRAIVGENMNPVSRIAGDALYGGAFGLASAGLSALSAIGDEIFTANNDGQSAAKTVVAALFGKEEKQNIQLADASIDTKKNQEASTQAATVSMANAEPETAGTATASAEKLTLAKAKLPFGGVMDTTLASNAQQQQTKTFALAGQNETLHAKRMIRSNRFAVAAPAPTMTTAAATPTPETQDAMQKLLAELHAMKGINQYQNAAQNTPLSGEIVDVVN